MGIMTWADGRRYEGYRSPPPTPLRTQETPMLRPIRPAPPPLRGTARVLERWVGRLTRAAAAAGSEWLDGKCTGNGTTTFKSGSRYVGVYHEDKMNGHGALRHAAATAVAVVGVGGGGRRWGLLPAAGCAAARGALHAVSWEADGLAPVEADGLAGMGIRLAAARRPGGPALQWWRKP